MSETYDNLYFAVQEQKKLDKLTPKQQLVYDVIQSNPGVQNDIMRLIEAVWLYEGWEDGKSLYWNLQRVTHAETISRRLRDLRTMGLVTLSKEAEERNYKAFKSERDAHSGHEKVKTEIVSPKYRIEIINGEMVTVAE